MPCDTVGSREGGVESRRAVLRAREVGDVLGAGVARGLGHALFVPEQQHLNAVAERGPAPSARRWISPILPSNGFGTEKIVSTRCSLARLQIGLNWEAATRWADRNGALL